MGQIKNIKLHIVTDIKSETKNVFLLNEPAGEENKDVDYVSTKYTDTIPLVNTSPEACKNSCGNVVCRLAESKTEKENGTHVSRK